jgi:protein involved in polysaccharide export with SLBB domain
LSKVLRTPRSVASAVAATFVLAATAPAFAAIHAGDTLSVKVWNHPELSKDVVVDAAGRVALPLSGSVPVAGLDERAAAARLTNALRPYVVYPAVSIQTVAQGKSIFVSSGPVGVVAYQPGEKLSAAVAEIMEPPATSGNGTQSLNEAGQTTTEPDKQTGVRARIDLRDVRVMRDGSTLGPFDTVALAQQGQTGPELQPGDTIAFTYKPIQVRVVGDVAQPGETYLSPTQTVSEAITQAGGVLPTAVSNRVLLQRDGQVHSLALGDPLFHSPAQNGDIVTVPVAPRVNVAGMVTTPGVVALRTDPTLLSAMYTAGGPTKWANLKDVQIVHQGQTTTYDVTQLTHGNITQNPMLADGDTVVVPEGHKIDFTNFFGVLAAFASRVP